MNPSEREARDAEIRALRDQKWTLQAIADKFGLGNRRVCSILDQRGREFDRDCRECGCTFQSKRSSTAFCSRRCYAAFRRKGGGPVGQSRPISARNAEIVALRESGKTNVEIAASMGISRQRVFQICKRAADEQ